MRHSCVRVTDKACFYQVCLGTLDVFMSDGHMVPMQWFPLVNPSADLPTEPLGFLKLNCIINTLGERGAVQVRPPDDLAEWELKRDPPTILQIPRLNLRKVTRQQYSFTTTNASTDD